MGGGFSESWGVEVTLWTWIKLARANRQQRLWKEAYDRGYNWAAGALLRGEMTPLEVEMYYYLPRLPRNAWSMPTWSWTTGTQDTHH